MVRIIHTSLWRRGKNPGWEGVTAGQDSGREKAIQILSKQVAVLNFLFCASSQTEQGDLCSAPGTMGCRLWFRYTPYMARTIPWTTTNLVNLLHLGITKRVHTIALRLPTHEPKKRRQQWLSHQALTDVTDHHSLVTSLWNSTTHFHVPSYLLLDSRLRRERPLASLPSSQRAATF